MVYRPGFDTLLPLLPVLLVHLAGVVVAASLLVRLKRRRGPAGLVLVGAESLEVESEPTSATPEEG